jgi:endonuclease/exonuclease/phosphatase family metal-dependent hydrolase
MKGPPALRLALLVTLILSAAVGAAPAGTNDPAPPLVVTTYNLRFASSRPPNEWAVRRPLMRELLREIAPDLLGTQEGLHDQLRDLAVDLPEYDWTGVGRDGGVRGEFMAVFYRRDRLEPLATNHFWLSDTPEVVASRTWGHTCNRMVTWLRFRDRRTAHEFYFFNTHFDHEAPVAREKSAELVRRRVAALGTNLPVLLVGDFNAAAGASRPYELLTREGFFTDTWTIAREREGEGLSTFNGFRSADRRGIRIDWILARGEVTVARAQINSFTRDGLFPSDHFPVTAWLRLGGGVE